MKMKRARKRLNQRIGDKDRLSTLPDCVLLHIMSFMITKFAVQTCILSKRWKNLWKCLPDLTLHTSDFSKRSIFSEFVSGVLSCRDNSYSLHKLDFDRHGPFQPQLLRRLMRYAVSHSVQQLKIYVPCNLSLSPSIFSCQSLTSLGISVSPYDVKRRSRVPVSLELPALVNLHLSNVAFYARDNGRAEPFSTCPKLITLCIDCCPLFCPDCHILVEAGVLCISNSTPANLTINNNSVSAHKTVVSTPNLSSFTLNGSPFEKLHGQAVVTVELQSCSLSVTICKRGCNPIQHAASAGVMNEAESTNDLGKADGASHISKADKEHSVITNVQLAVAMENKEIGLRRSTRVRMHNRRMKEFVP